MKNIWKKTFGKGEKHLVLLHGWGLSAKVWNCVGTQLSSNFTIHLVDLPGFGRSSGFGAMKLNEMAELVLQQAPTISFWIGWSLGGLVASHIATTNPHRVQALITVAFSPCFCSQDGWPGIKSEILSEFQCQLRKNLQFTVYRFLALQTMGTSTARKDTRTLKNFLSVSPLPEIQVLNGGLDLLKKEDLREPLSKFKGPHLRIYGALDSLVPCEIAPLLDKHWPYSKSLVMKRAAHVPFISHTDYFLQSVIDFISRMHHK